MLKINDNKYNVLSSQIKFVNAKYNKQKGYSILATIDIELNGVKGYISFHVDFFNDIDFIDSNVIVKFGNIFDNQIGMYLKINDELIKLDYQGILDII